MSRLNLDIFGPEEKRKAVRKTPPQTTGASIEKAPSGDSPPVPSETPKESPKFVPVGFHSKHLRLLDDAVLSLRRKGQWKASKSSIIRRLIELHADDLASIWSRRGKR